MTLRFIEDTTEPEPWDAPKSKLMLEMIAVHAMMRTAKYRNDYADDWTPDWNRDCQGKTSAALIELHHWGVPLSAMRGYAGGAAIKKKGKYLSHAALVVRVTAEEPLNHIDYVLDHCQVGVRSMLWMTSNGLYRKMQPAMRAEPSA